MNVNDFLVPPNNKAKSVKLNARNLQDLQKVTATLADRSREMEEKLQQLKDNMSKEKQERGISERLKYSSGQCGSLTSNFQINNSNKNKESRLQKLSAGKVKIRLLKDELLPTGPPQPPPPVRTFGHQGTRKSALNGTACGQCDVRIAGVKCPECAENYCIGCFNKFHQKGALKLHRMVPIQRDLQTHVNSQDIAICLQKTINPSFQLSTTGVPSPSTSASSITPKPIARQGVKSPGKSRKAEDNHMKLHSDCSQVLIVDHGEKRQEEVIGIDEPPSTLLRGHYNEEESARAFQEAVRQWRGEKGDGGAELLTDENAGRIPARTASVSARATQADLCTDKGAQGQRRAEGEGRVTVKVEFTPNSLTYADRLLLKKHRRTPIYVFDSPVPFSAQPATIQTEEISAGSLTAEEEDFREYWASLFDAPVSRDRIEPQITPPESCLAIVGLNETYTDMKHACDTKQRTEINPRIISVQRITRKERPLVPETSLSGGAIVDISLSSSGPSQTSRSSLEAVPPETDPKRLSSKQDAPQALRSPKTLPSKSKPSAFSTTEASGTSKASIRTPTSKSLRSICSPTVHKSKANHGSPQFLSSLSHSQPDVSKSSHSPIPFSADVLASTNNKSAIPEEHLSHSPSTSFSLRSSFTVSPLGSTESTLLPKVYCPTPLQEGSDSSVSDVKQTFPLFAKPISSPELCESPRGSTMPQQQSQPSLCDRQPLLSNKPTQLLLSHVSTSKHAPPKSLERSQSELGPEIHGTPANSLSRVSLFSEFSPEECYTQRSTPTYQEVQLIMSPAQECEDHLSTPHWDTHSAAHGILIPSRQRLHVNHKAALTVNMEEQKESKERGDEMSSDSRLTFNEEDSPEEEVLMEGYSARARTNEEQEHPAISQLQESFVPSESEAGMDYQTDKTKQLLGPSVVMHERGAGPGSQQFCDLNGLSPLGLDLNAGDFDTREHAHCDPLHTCQTAPHDTHPTGSESRGSCRSLRTSLDQHLAFTLMKDNNTEPTGVKIHSTGGSKISQTEPGTSEFDPAPRTLSQAAQEIKEICSVDQTGCEDPDLDTDITAHILYGQKKLMTEEASLVCRMGIGGNSGQPGNCHFMWSKVGDEEEEEAVKSDQHAVLLLP